MKKIDETGVVHFTIHGNASNWTVCGRRINARDPLPEVSSVTCMLCLMWREEFRVTHRPANSNGRAVRDEYGYYTSLCSAMTPRRLKAWTVGLSSDQISEHAPMCLRCLGKDSL